VPRERIEFAGVSLAARVLPVLPVAVYSPLARLAGNAVWSMDPRGRRVARANLRAAFPGRFTASEVGRVARASYASFARTMIELVSARGGRPGFLDRFVEFDDSADPVRTDPGRSAIYICFHYSNFEWLSLYGALRIMPAPIIAQRFRNPLIGPVFDRLRAVTGHHVIPQERAMIRMLGHLREKKKFGMLTDLGLDPREGGAIINAFGGLALNATHMHVALAQRTGAAIIPLEIRPRGLRRYRVVHHPPIECPRDADPRPLVQKCWDALESAVREEPEHWLWAYKHWRFRPGAGDASRYPFYANRSKRFDKALKKAGLAGGTSGNQA